MIGDDSITEADLQAYVDEALPEERREAVGEYLRHDPEAARRIEGFRAQRAGLRELFAPVAEEPVPPELSLTRRLAVRRQPRREFWRNAAAAVVLLAVGGSAGWLARGQEEPPDSGVAALAREAADSYAVFAMDRTRPVELRPDEQEQLVNWIADRLHRPVAVPDLAPSGYHFMGGRLVSTSHGPAGFFLYGDGHGTRLAVLVRPMAVDQTARMTEHDFGNIQGYAWAREGIGYTLMGTAATDVLHPLANEVRRQLNTMS